MTTVSICIPTRDKAPRLALTLACLRAQRDAAIEVIVIDDGSSDHTPAVIAAAGRSLPVVGVRDTGRGRAAARNRAAERARGDTLIFLDDDILVGPRFVTAHAAAQAAAPGLVHGRLREMIGVTRAADPATGGPGAPPLSAERLAARGFSVEGYRLAANALERAVEMTFAGEGPSPVSWLAGAGANLSLPRRAWAAVGGYDESFATAWGCEDLEFALRLSLAGIAIDVSPEAWGVHMSHERADRWEQHQLNFERFVARHPLPAVSALPLLLGPEGSPARYFAALATQTRSP